MVRETEWLWGRECFSVNLNVSCDRSFARRAQNPNIADVIFQVEPEIKCFGCRFLCCSALKLY